MTREKFYFLQNIYHLKPLFYFMAAAKVTPTKVAPYKRDVPKTYEAHPGKVRGWVPEGSPNAERSVRKKR